MNRSQAIDWAFKINRSQAIDWAFRVGEYYLHFYLNVSPLAIAGDALQIGQKARQLANDLYKDRTSKWDKHLRPNEQERIAWLEAAIEKFEQELKEFTAVKGG